MKTKSKYYNETKNLFNRLKKAGWPVVAVDNGEDLTIGGTQEKLLDEALACDEAHIYFSHSNGGVRKEIGQKTLWAFLVLGNDPGELVSDYSYPRGDEAAEKELEDFFTKFGDDWEKASPNI